MDLWRGLYLAGRLTIANNASSSVTRDYDGAGRLTRDKQNVVGLGLFDVQHVYDAANKITKTVRSRGTLSASNVYGIGIDEILLRFTPTTVHSFHQDRLDSVTHVTPACRFRGAARAGWKPACQFRLEA